MVPDLLQVSRSLTCTNRTYQTTRIQVRFSEYFTKENNDFLEKKYLVELANMCQFYREVIGRPLC